MSRYEENFKRCVCAPQQVRYDVTNVTNVTNAKKKAFFDIIDFYKVMDNDDNSSNDSQLPANILADLHQVEPNPVAPHANQRFTPIQQRVLLSSPSEINAYSALKATFEKKRKRSEDDEALKKLRASNRQSEHCQSKILSNPLTSVAQERMSNQHMEIGFSSAVAPELPLTSSTYRPSIRPPIRSVSQPIQQRVLPPCLSPQTSIRGSLGSASLPYGAPEEQVRRPPEEQVRRPPEVIVNSAPAEDRLQVQRSIISIILSTR
jgi:hypothetical protein